MTLLAILRICPLPYLGVMIALSTVEHAKKSELMSNSNETQLMNRLAERDQTAMSELYDRYSGVLLAVIVKIVRVHSEAEDVLQDVFIAAWDNAHKYDEKKAGLYSWLITIARNRAIDRVRSKSYKTQQKSTESALESLTDQKASPLTLQLASERKEIVAKALSELPEEQQALIRICFYEGFTHKEAAEKLGVPLGTAKTRIRLGMKKLTEALKETIGGSHAA